MLDLLVGSDLIRRQMKESLETTHRKVPEPEPRRTKRAAVRSTSAAALRDLADRLEPSPSA
jgi:hypothetical protein